MGACSKDPEVAKREYLRSGDRYASEKKFREAIVEYRNAIQQDPRYGEARLKLGDSYVEVGDVANAYREYLRAADLLPDNFEAQLKAGELLLMAEQYEDARARADKALAAAPANVKAQILRANALAGLNDVEQALAQIEEAIRSAPDQTASYASLGAIQMMRGNRPEAEAAFRKAVETDARSIPARLALANFYWTAGRGPQAEAELTQAFQLDPRDGLVNRALAYFYLGADRPREAEPYFKAVAEAVPGAGRLMLADYYISQARGADARPVLESIPPVEEELYATAQLRLAVLDLDAGDAVSAIKLVEGVLALQPSHSEALTIKAHMLIEGRKLDEALAAAQASVKADPRSATSHFMLGRVRGARGEPLEAIGALNEALRLNPRMVGAEIELARMHLAAQQLPEAEQYARSAIEKVPGSVDAHLILTRVSLFKGDIQTAEASLKLLSSAVPDAPSVQTEIGLLHLARRERPAARAAFERLLAGNPSHYEAVAALTRLDVEDGKAPAALKRIAAAVRTRPDDGRFRLLSSAVYGAMKDTAAEERALREAIEVDPANLQAYGMLGAFYAGHGRLPEATAEFEKLASKQPRSVAVHTVIAMLLEAQRRPTDAKAQYEKVLSVDSRAPVAANNLAWLYAESGGNLDIALHLAQTAKSQLGDSPEVDDTLGWIYHKKGVGSLAISSLSQAVAKNPANPTFQYHLGVAYAASGAPDKARAALNKALSLDTGFAHAAEARQVLARLQ
jgi:tetratricopeptide (TPR) repeat protein